MYNNPLELNIWTLTSYDFIGILQSHYEPLNLIHHYDDIYEDTGGHFMTLVISDNLSFTDKYSDILDFDWLWSTVIDCCHGNSQWMTNWQLSVNDKLTIVSEWQIDNCQWWQVSWNAPQKWCSKLVWFTLCKLKLFIIGWQPKGHFIAPLRTRRALILYKVYGICTLLVLNWYRVYTLLVLNQCCMWMFYIQMTRVCVLLFIKYKMCHI